MHFQFCSADRDISSDYYAHQDATEVRAWADDFCVIAVERTGDDTWVYSGSDNGHLYSDAQKAAAHRSWRHALNAFGVEYGK